jgi:hypothetical protein
MWITKERRLYMELEKIISNVKNVLKTFDEDGREA